MPMSRYGILMVEIRCKACTARYFGWRYGDVELSKPTSKSLLSHADLQDIAELFPLPSHSLVIIM
jgi:hypothetical protein